MEHKTIFVKIWDVISPMFLYFFITALTLLLLDFIIPINTDTKLLRQLISSVVVLPFLYPIYGKRLGFSKNCLWMFLAGGVLSVVLNNILGFLNLESYSASYGQVEATFYTGRILLEIVALCIIIPFVEELLYRGIIYDRLKGYMGIKSAMIISSLIFGMVHMNLVQFVYAFIFGFVLAGFVEKNGDISGAVAAHMAANLLSVLRAEFGIF